MVVYATPSVAFIEIASAVSKGMGIIGILLLLLLLLLLLYLLGVVQDYCPSRGFWDEFIEVKTSRGDPELNKGKYYFMYYFDCLEVQLWTRAVVVSISFYLPHRFGITHVLFNLTLSVLKKL